MEGLTRRWARDCYDIRLTGLIAETSTIFCMRGSASNWTIRGVWPVNGAVALRSNRDHTVPRPLVNDRIEKHPHSLFCIQALNQPSSLPHPSLVSLREAVDDRPAC